MNVLLKDGPLAGRVLEGLLDSGHRVERSCAPGQIAVYANRDKDELVKIIKQHRGEPSTIQAKARIYTFVGYRTEQSGWQLQKNHPS